MSDDELYELIQHELKEADAETLEDAKQGIVVPEDVDEEQFLRVLQEVETDIQDSRMHGLLPHHKNEEPHGMAKKKAKSAKVTHKKPTSARLLKNRPADPEEPPESSEQEPEEASTEDTSKKTRQARLPGTEDAAIESLEALAEEYVEVRDRRMALTAAEADFQQKLLAEMKALDKKRYVHDGVQIEVIATDEKVRVRIKKDE